MLPYILYKCIFSESGPKAALVKCDKSGKIPGDVRCDVILDNVKMAYSYKDSILDQKQIFSDLS